MSKYSREYIDEAYRHTLHNEQEVMAGNLCTCFFCGNIFNPHEVEEFEWLDRESPKGRTAVCPLCPVDCVISAASGFPVTDPEFIAACTEAWFGSASEILQGHVPGTPVHVNRIIVE